VLTHQGWVYRPRTTVIQAQLEAGIPILDALTLTKQCPSKSDARRQVQQGGVSNNNEKVTAIEHVLQTSDLVDGKIIIRKGKKDFHAICIND